MAIAVTTVASGGLPVTDVTATHTSLGLHVAEVAKGLAITKGPGGLPVNFAPIAGGGGGGGGAEATAFLARTTGLDAPHTAAYTALIDGLVADGVWAKLDVLHVYATQNSATALLNLVSTSYTGVPNGSPIFTADRGYTGVNGSSTVYINTTFNPTTASSPKYTLTSCHISAWSVANFTSVGVAGCIIGMDGSSGAQRSNIFARYEDGSAYFRINHLGSTGGVATANSAGHYLANRSANQAAQGYKNGGSIYTDAALSGTLVNKPFWTLALSDQGGGYGGQVAMDSIGASLNSTEATAFYNRLRTYMTAVGVP